MFTHRIFVAKKKPLQFSNGFSVPKPVRFIGNLALKYLKINLLILKFFHRDSR